MWKVLSFALRSIAPDIFQGLCSRSLDYGPNSTDGKAHE